MAYGLNIRDKVNNVEGNDSYQSPALDSVSSGEIRARIAALLSLREKSRLEEDNMRYLDGEIDLDGEINVNKYNNVEDFFSGINDDLSYLIDVLNNVRIGVENIVRILDFIDEKIDGIRDQMNVCNALEKDKEFKKLKDILDQFSSNKEQLEKLKNQEEIDSLSYSDFELLLQEYYRPGNIIDGITTLTDVDSPLGGRGKFDSLVAINYELNLMESELAELQERGITVEKPKLFPQSKTILTDEQIRDIQGEVASSILTMDMRTYHLKGLKGFLNRFFYIKYCTCESPDLYSELLDLQSIVYYREAKVQDIENNYPNKIEPQTLAQWHYRKLLDNWDKVLNPARQNRVKKVERKRSWKKMDENIDVQSPNQKYFKATTAENEPQLEQVTSDLSTMELAGKKVSDKATTAENEPQLEQVTSDLSTMELAGKKVSDKATTAENEPQLEQVTSDLSTMELAGKKVSDKATTAEGDEMLENETQLEQVTADLSMVELAGEKVSDKATTAEGDEMLKNETQR